MAGEILWFKTSAGLAEVVLDNYDIGVDLEARALVVGDGHTIGGIPLAGAPVNPDWNAIDGLAMILNKPALARVATSGSYTDLSNTPTAISLLSQLGDDALHRLVTDTMIGIWNAKQNALAAGVDYLAPTGNGAGLSGIATSVAGRTGAVALAQADIAGLRGTDTPSFAGLTVVGDLHVGGTVNTVSSQNLLVKDTELVLNDGETGNGVTAGSAGIAVDRGLLASARLLWDEASQKFKAGVASLYEILTTNSTTADLGDSVNRRYVTDAQRTVLGNTSGANSGDVTLATANGLSLAGQALSLQTASATQTGALSSADWSTFNGKQAALGFTPMKTDFSNMGTAPTWNQDTTGSAARLSGASALPNGTTATTQAAHDNSTKVATTAYVDAAVAAPSGMPYILAQSGTPITVIYPNSGLTWTLAADPGNGYTRITSSGAHGLTAAVANGAAVYVSAWSGTGVVKLYTIGNVVDTLNLDLVLTYAAGLGNPTVTGFTNGDVPLASITVPAGAMGANGCLRVTTMWSYYSGTPTRALKQYFGGQYVCNRSVQGYSASHEIRHVRNRGSQSAQVVLSPSNTAYLGDGAANAILSVDTTQAVVYSITAALGAANSWLRLEGYTVEVLPGA